LSGYMFESALEAGFVAAGVNVQLIGPLPTPGIAYMTRRFNCDFGVVISASHNPFDDNGIKFFDASGGKLSDELEERIEAELAQPPITRISRSLGRATRVDRSRTLYQEFCYKVGPRVLADLGAEIVPIGCSPNGRNINDGCGSTAPDLLQLTVPGVRAHVGLALDGDGDRLVMVDHLGRIVDGDQLLYVIARARKEAGTLKGPVVGTVMTNLGLEVAFRENGIEFMRAPVGDRYVLAMLRDSGGTLGGETSGHILCLDKTTTGDGLVSGLQVLGVMKKTGRSLAELSSGMRKFPQVLLNVKVARRFDPSTVPSVQEAVQKIEKRMGGDGRVVLRASGTEPVIRVMVEGKGESTTRAAATELAEVVKAAAE
jgi:phosphoglucosamine mutase